MLRGNVDRLRILAGAAVTAALGLMVVFVIAVDEAREGLRIIGHRDGPAVVATSNVYFALSDMDAQAANILLVGDRTDLGLSRAEATKCPAAPMGGQRWT